MSYVDFFSYSVLCRNSCVHYTFISAVLCSCLSARAVNYFSCGEYNDVCVYSWLCVTDLTIQILHYRVTLCCFTILKQLFCDSYFRFETTSTTFPCKCFHSSSAVSLLYLCKCICCASLAEHMLYGFEPINP